MVLFKEGKFEPTGEYFPEEDSPLLLIHPTAWQALGMVVGEQWQATMAAVRLSLEKEWARPRLQCEILAPARPSPICDAALGSAEGNVAH